MSSADAASLNFWSTMYEVVVCLVALGVGMEGCEIVSRRRAKWKQKQFVGPLQQPFPEPQTPPWAHNIGDIGFVILVAALIFEPICHSKIEAITGRENRRLTTELTSTTEKAGKAIERAGEAIERASTNELQVEELKQENLVLQTKLTEMRKGESEMAKAMQAKLITNVEISNFIESLKEAPKGPVRIVAPGYFKSGLEYTGNYIEHMRIALSGAGYTVKPVEDWPTNAPPPTWSAPTDLVLCVRNRSELPTHINALERAFTAIGLKTISPIQSGFGVFVIETNDVLILVVKHRFNSIDQP